MLWWSAFVQNEVVYCRPYIRQSALPGHRQGRYDILYLNIIPRLHLNLRCAVLSITLEVDFFYGIYYSRLSLPARNLGARHRNDIVITLYATFVIDTYPGYSPSHDVLGFLLANYGNMRCSI